MRNSNVLVGPVALSSGTGVSTALIGLLAVGTGTSVASLYYNQPMLGVLGTELGGGAALGLVPTLTQLGYAAGLLFLAPLGDRYDRRTLILVKALGLALALIGAASATTIGALLIASLAIGVTATLAQDIVPAAAALAPDAHRGKVVGSVMTGLLLGILLSRVASGFVAQHFGWRAMFGGAAVVVAVVGTAVWRVLPSAVPSTGVGYGALFGSLIRLWREHGALRRAAVAQGLLSIGFSAFWSTLAVMLHAAPFELGSAAAGAFGLAGAAGALAAPIAGRMADRHGPERVTRIGAGIAMVAFAAMAVGPLVLGATGQLVLIGVGALAFDLGVQATMIAHQTIVYGIDRGARSRLNAVLYVTIFVGMAVGSSVGSVVLARLGWSGVTGMAAVAALAAIVVRGR